MRTRTAECGCGRVQLTVEDEPVQIEEDGSVLLRTWWEPPGRDARRLRRRAEAVVDDAKPDPAARARRALPSGQYVSLGQRGGDAMQVLSESSCEFGVIADFASRDASSAHLAVGSGESHVYMLQFEAGGVIGQHQAGFGQVLIVLAGSGWVSGDDGSRVEVGAGGVVYIERGEQHAKGSDTGMTALMVQVRDLSRVDGGTTARPSGDPPD